jgi:hypothetical protein
MNIGHCGRVSPPGGSELHAGRTVSHAEEEAKILEDERFAIEKSTCYLGRLCGAFPAEAASKLFSVILQLILLVVTPFYT